MGKCFNHLTLQDRKFLEKMLKKNVSVSVIADTLCVNKSTIYREIKKGTYLHTYNYFDKKEYSCDKGQLICNNNRAKSYNPLKLRGKYLLDIERLLLNKYSPEMALKACKYENIVSVKTVYNYINNCVFSHYRNLDLINGKRSPRVKKDRTHKNKIALQHSIEYRNLDIYNRDIFGNWEMDTVIGQTGHNSCLLVLTERMTRYEMIFKIKAKNCLCVVNTLRFLQRKFGSDYSKIFKTITIDNGSEFSDFFGMKRFSSTNFYYCHPYSSWERGTNENRNRLIRRFIPKGKNIDDYSTDYIKMIESWVNTYPLKLFNYQNPQHLYQKELSKLFILPKCCI